MNLSTKLKITAVMAAVLMALVWTVPARLGWRRRAEIEVVLALQLTDGAFYVREFSLFRRHCWFDLVQLPCETPTLRAAVPPRKALCEERS